MAFLLVAALLGARRTVQAVEMLRRLETITATRPDWRPWRARLEFLWAVFAEQTADIPGVLEHSAAATRLMGAGDHPSVVLETQGGHLLHTIDSVASARLPLLAARARIGLGDPYEAQAILEARYGSLGAAEARQPALMATVACGQGRLSDALRLADAALHRAQRDGGPTEFENLEARVVLAEVFFERNALDAAQVELQAALRWCCLTEATPWMWTVKASLARLAVAQATGRVTRCPASRISARSGHQAFCPSLWSGPSIKLKSMAGSSSVTWKGRFDLSEPVDRTTSTGKRWPGLSCARGAPTASSPI